jgi:hypothetical protein
MEKVVYARRVKDLAASGIAFKYLLGMATGRKPGGQLEKVPGAAGASPYAGSVGHRAPGTLLRRFDPPTVGRQTRNLGWQKP